MKKLLLLTTLFLGLVCTAQESYFTLYNFEVESEDVSTIYKLFDDYFSENKPTGVTVALWENHFNDSGNNFSHSVVFSGTLDAMGSWYNQSNDDSWRLFLTRINQHMKSGFNSAMGTQLASYGDTGAEHRYQRYYLLDVAEGSKWVDSYKEMMEGNNPEGRLNMMGNFSVGHSPDGENFWVINGFKDFKAAIAGVGALRTDAEKEAASEAWDKHREEGGDVSLVRSGMRILLKAW